MAILPLILFASVRTQIAISSGIKHDSNSDAEKAGISQPSDPMCCSRDGTHNALGIKNALIGNLVCLWILPADEGHPFAA
ncbi:MAG: hypothetical protein AAF664_23635 [Planctomycetota bacterium]